MAAKKWVYLFEELDLKEQHVGGCCDEVHGFFGGRGANLAEMQRIGLPVPSSFIISTEACNANMKAGGVLPEWMCTRESSGNRFGNKNTPLLIFCRSGAKFSMPGMMDTELSDLKMRSRAARFREHNPILGLRGVRLGIHIPATAKMPPWTDQFPTLGVSSDTDHAQGARLVQECTTQCIGLRRTDLMFYDFPGHFRRMEDSYFNDRNQTEIIHKTDYECIFGATLEASREDTPAPTGGFQQPGHEAHGSGPYYLYKKFGDETGNLNILLFFFLLILGAVVGSYLYLAVTGASIPQELRESLKNIVAYCIGIASGIAISPQYPRS